MSSHPESEFDTERAWSDLQSTARRMGEAEDPAIYDALKAQFDALVANLRKSGASPPDSVLNDPLLRTQFVQRTSKSGEVDGKGVEVVDELFGVKIEPRAIPTTSTGSEDFTEVESSNSSAPPSSEELSMIDELIRRSKVAQMRGNRDEAASLLKQAESIAPSASTVLEAIGDELASARKFQEARRYYDRARRADPQNTSADRKFADSVFRSDAAKHTYANLDDSEVVADPRKAAILSYFVPGLGQFVTGQWLKGSIFLLGSFVCMLSSIRLGLMSGLAGIAGAKTGTPPSSFAYVLAGAGFIVYIANIVDMATRAKSTGARAFGRPTPPENLPYE